VENSESEESDQTPTQASEDVTSSDEGNAVEHTLRVTVHGMQGFLPCSNQVLQLLVLHLKGCTSGI